MSKQLRHKSVGVEELEWAAKALAEETVKAMVALHPVYCSGEFDCKHVILLIRLHAMGGPHVGAR